MEPERNSQSIDELLADLHQLLDDQPSESAVSHIDDLLYDDRQVNRPTQEPAPQSRPEPAPTRSWAETQKLPKHVAKLQRNQEQAYADWLYEQGRQDIPPVPQKRQQPVPEYQPGTEEPEPPKKKRHGLRNFIIFLLILILALSALLVFVLPRQPMAAVAPWERKDGVTTLLLAGTDDGEARTDTLMLLTLDQTARSIHLVSIPRDTLINGSYSVPKINGVYGINGGGEAGMEMLLTRVQEIIGFAPDGYMLVDLNVFMSLVDALGGVEFDVPVDMFYNDPAQNLFIDLRAGKQTLNGEEAMGLVRFRSGYADADLSRVQVQRDFLSAMLDQALSPKGWTKAPAMLQLLANHTQSDLTLANYLWLARTALLADRNAIAAATLPGNAAYLSGGSYYILDPASVAQTVNVYCSPYEYTFTAADLQIRTG